MLSFKINLILRYNCHINISQLKRYKQYKKIYIKRYKQYKRYIVKDINNIKRYILKDIINIKRYINNLHIFSVINI